MKIKQFFRNLSHVQIIAMGFVLLIAFGTILLMTPFATTDSRVIPFSDALFTATSASCVTGLVTVDTGTTWSVFGQIVILSMIQIGGLGFMTIATLFFMLFRKRLGLRQKEIMSESINSSSIGGIRKMIKTIILGTITIEAVAALILFFRFYFFYNMSFKKAILFGIFHSVSAFCNAGFDIVGNYQSLVPYANDIVIVGTIIFLIVIGGIGFFVWDDLLTKRFCFKRWSLHTKLTLTTTAALIFIPAVLFYFLEQSASHEGMSFSQSILASLFDSVTARTAGMNLSDTSALSHGGKMMTILLMFIGGSPSSTAGGIKTTTFIVLVLFSLTTMRKARYIGAFGRRIEPDAVQKAMSVFFINLSLALIGILAIFAIQPTLRFDEIVFEVFSAIGTVGLSSGVTRDLNLWSQLVIIVLMFAGRVGSVSFGTALIEKRASPPILVPYEKITIG